MPVFFFLWRFLVFIDPGSYSISRRILFFLKLKKKCFLNWRVIALECRVGFCRVTAWTRHNYVCAPSLRPPPPCESSQRRAGPPVSQRSFPPATFFAHGSVCMSAPALAASPHLAFPHCDPSPFPTSASLSLPASACVSTVSPDSTRVC